MRFTDTTRKILVHLWLNGTSMEVLASSYTTTPDAIEKMIRTQLALERPLIKKV